MAVSIQLKSGVYLRHGNGRVNINLSNLLGSTCFIGTFIMWQNSSAFEMLSKIWVPFMSTGFSTVVFIP